MIIESHQFVHSLVSNRRPLRLLQKLVFIVLVEQRRQPVPASGPGTLHLDTGSKVNIGSHFVNLPCVEMLIFGRSETLWWRTEFVYFSRQL